MGLIHEPLDAVLDAAFTRHPELDTIKAGVGRRSTASATVLTRLGGHQTRRAAHSIQIVGDECDRSEWRFDKLAPT